MKHYNVKQIAKYLEKWHDSEIIIINDDDVVIDGYRLKRTQEPKFNPSTHCYHKVHIYTLYLGDYIYQTDSDRDFHNYDEFDQECYGLYQIIKDIKDGIRTIEDIVWDYELIENK